MVTEKVAVRGLYIKYTSDELGHAYSCNDEKRLTMFLQLLSFGDIRLKFKINSESLESQHRLF